MEKLGKQSYGKISRTSSNKKMSQLWHTNQIYLQMYKMWLQVNLKISLTFLKFYYKNELFTFCKISASDTWSFIFHNLISQYIYFSFGRHSKSLNLEKKRCGYCYGEFELITNKINKNPVPNNFPVEYTDPLKELYKLNDVQEKPKLPKKPSKFALFVKDNYGRVKKENPLSKHGEIMKLLGSQFATTKILTPDEIFDKLLDS